MTALYKSLLKSESVENEARLESQKQQFEARLTQMLKENNWSRDSCSPRTSHAIKIETKGSEVSAQLGLVPDTP